MAQFLAVMSNYPTAIYTVLLGVVLFYWALAMIGLVDIEGLDLDFDSDSDIGGEGLTGLAGFMLAMGLDGVPFSVVVSLLLLLAWLFTSLGSIALSVLPWLLQVVLGTGLLIVSFAVSIPITARMVRPIKGLFVTHRAVSNAELVGRTCRITTLSVSETFGQAFLEDGGGGLNLRVRAATPNSLTKGSAAAIVEYRPETDTYEVVENPEH
jgi:hypothetical protein